MTSRARFQALPLGLLLVALLTGCGTAGQLPSPQTTAQIAEAQATVNQADQVGAPEHAPLELRMAQQKLEAANVAVAEGKHDKARRLAAEAQVDAELAQIKALSTKSQLAVRQLKESIQALRDEIARNQ